MENNEECLLSKDLMEEIGLDPDQVEIENDYFLLLNFSSLCRS